MRRVCLVSVICIGISASSLASDPSDSDWPCIQRKVPTITAGMVWAGPEIDPADRLWRKVEGLENMVGNHAARRIPLESAYTEIDKYAKAQTDKDRTTRLSALFIGLLQTINKERSEIISGIERFNRRQKVLAERIKVATRKRTELRSAPIPDREKIATLQEQILWDTRIFDERNQMLSYVCESPVILEQRLFALSRRIMSHLD